MARPAVKTERRNQILDALFAVMAQSGGAGASVTEIAERAGVARGALHYFFTSKDEVVVELMRRLGGGYLSRLAGWLDQAEATGRSDVVGGLVRWHFAGDADENARLMSVWIDFWGQAQSHPTIQAAVFEVQEAARDLCRRALLVDQPLFSALPAASLRAAGSSLLAIIEGGLLQWRVAFRSSSPLDRTVLSAGLAQAARALVHSLASPSHEVA